MIIRVKTNNKGVQKGEDSKPTLTSACNCSPFDGVSSRSQVSVLVVCQPTEVESDFEVRQNHATQVIALS